MNPNWKFAFRENIPLFWAELIDYSKGDYIFLAEGKEMSSYIKKGNIPRKVKGLIFKLKENNKEVRKNNYSLNGGESLFELLKLFEKIMKKMSKRSKLYNATEAENFDSASYSKKEIEQIGKLRFESKKENRKNWMFIFNKLLEAISKETKISVNNLRFLRCGEIIKLNKVKPKADVIKGRKKSWGIIQEKGEKRFLTKTEIKNIKRDFFEDSKTIFFGTGTFPGKVKGIAKVITSMNNKAKLNNLFKKDKLPNILITSMTQPDIVMYANNIGGMVTDEGGILCHAGILSREFKIPCIVGTREATKKIKNGDIVELDANTGEVKILKKKR